MSFSKIFTESKIDEGAGSLAGLPSKFIKIIVKGYDYGGLGGENSQIKLFKAKAKQKDITAAAKFVGGFVKREDRGSRSYSRAELQASADNKGHAGLLIKVDGEWAFMASYSEYTQDGGNYQLVSNEGNTTVKRWWAGNKYNRGGSFDSKYLKAGEISNFIDFDDAVVDIYLVTTDVERIMKREERKSSSAVSSVTPEKKAALLKFVQKRAKGIIDEVTIDLRKELDKIVNTVESYITRATEGKEVEETIDVGESVKRLNEKMKSVASIGYIVAGIVKEGKIKSYRGEDTYEYRKLKELVSEFNKEEI